MTLLLQCERICSRTDEHEHIMHIRVTRIKEMTPLTEMGVLDRHWLVMAKLDVAADTAMN